MRTDLGGDQADLAPEEGAKGILEIADGLTSGDTGKFFDIYVPDWDREAEKAQYNRYEGGNLPW